MQASDRGTIESRKLLNSSLSLLAENQVKVVIMNMQEVDRTVLKSVIKELLIEDLSIFKDIIRELLIENQVIVDKEQENRRNKLERMISDDFDKYEDVFQALAK